jgi:hypothetical protein
VSADDLLRAYVAAALGDGEDQARVAEELDRVQHGVAADAVLLLQGLDRGQRAGTPLPGGNPPGENARELAIRRLGQIGINYVKFGHWDTIADQNRPRRISGLI